MLSIQQELQQYLSVFLTEEGDAPERIGLYRLPRRSGIAYRSAIALELAAGEAQAAEVFARKLRDRLEKNADRFAFTTRAIEGGWLEFQLCDRALALWLQEWLEGMGGGGALRLRSATDGETGERNFQTLVFPVQYARVRCCSLLRSAHRDKIIELEGLETSSPSWRWLHPQPIPWSSADSETATLRLQHPAEQQLIQRLVEVTDVLAGVSKGELTKLALSLGEAMLECDRACRIWGEVKRDTPDLAIARLALLAVTRGAIDRLFREMGIQPLTTL